MKGLPSSVQLKLVESDSTPSLDTMLSFSQRFRAIEELPRPSVCAAMDQPLSDLAPEQHEQITRQSHEIKALQYIVREVSEGHQNIISALSSPPTRVAPRRSQPVRCFYCHEEGHIVRQCPKRRGAVRCAICSGWGHRPESCGNVRQDSTGEVLIADKGLVPRQNRPVNQAVNNRELSLNYQGMPR